MTQAKVMMVADSSSSGGLRPDYLEEINSGFSGQAEFNMVEQVGRGDADEAI